jgi:hypothetical protein
MENAYSLIFWFPREFRRNFSILWTPQMRQSVKIVLTALKGEIDEAKEVHE